MADDKIQLTIAVNAETGALEVVGKGLDDIGAKAGKTKSSFSGLSGEAGSLVKSLLPFASAAAIGAFFTSAVRGAEEQNEAFRRLRGTLEGNGQSWDKNKSSVESWVNSIQSSTRFSDTQAITTLDKLTRVTGSLTQAQKASQLAMNLSVASGMDLGQATTTVTDLLNGNQRALIQLNREYGSLTGEAKTTQEALDILDGKLAGAAEKSEGLTDSSAKLSNAFGQFKDVIGNAVIPVLIPMVNFVTKIIQSFEQMGLVVAGQAAKLVVTFSGMGEAISRAFRLDFSGAKKAMQDISTQTQAIDSEMELQFSEMEAKKTATLVKHTEERLVVSAAGQQKLKEQKEKELAEVAEHQQKLIAIEQDLDQKLAQLGQQTYEKKIARLNAEVAATQAKINKEHQLGVNASKAQDALNNYRKAQEQILAQEEVQLKISTSLQIADVAVQTLQVLNSMGSKGSESERIRAKALLALQQSITIGWIWVAAAKSAAETGLLASPGIFALAAAQTALAVAQFAQGVQNIDRAASAEAAGIQATNITGGIPGIDTNAPISGLGGESGGGGSSSLGGGGSGGGGGGGGGGGNVINLYQTNNFNVDKISADNLNEVMRLMAEKVRQGSIEGVQLGLSLQAASDKNSGMAA